MSASSFLTCLLTDQNPLIFDMLANSIVDSKGTKSVSIMTTGHEKDRFKVCGLLRKRNLLVWDSFRAHLSEDVKWVLKISRTDVAVIPGGMTSLLQPFDVGVNKPLKDNLRQFWNKWMLDGNHTFTPAGSIRKPDLRQICQWILESWNVISPDTIKRSFLKCCITNVLDGTENDILWEEMDESDPFADDDGVESIVDEEGELFYAGEDKVNEQEYSDIFGEHDVDESDVNGF